MSDSYIPWDDLETGEILSWARSAYRALRTSAQTARGLTSREVLTLLEGLKEDGR